MFSNSSNSDGLQSLSVIFRTGVRILTIFTGCMTLIMGIFSCVTLSAFCLIAGIVMIICGICILSVEASFCCKFFTFGQSMQMYSDYFDKLPCWIRSVIYAIIAVIPVLLCHNALVLFSSLLTLACSAIYFMIAIGQRSNTTNIDTIQDNSSDQPWA